MIKGIVKLKLTDNWLAVLRHAYSVRFALLSALLGGVSRVFDVDPYLFPLPLDVSAIIAGLLSAAAGLAVVAAGAASLFQQKDLPK